MKRKLQSLCKILLCLPALLLLCGILLLGAGHKTRASADGAVHTFVLGTSDENTSEITYEHNPADGWAQAVALSQRLFLEGKENLIKVQLELDWIAADIEGGTSFGVGGEAFYSNMIFVPQGANILLDLNGCVINRNLTEAVAGGGVLAVAGELELIDSRPDVEQLSLSYGTEEEPEYVQGGALTGGNTTENGGAVFVLIGGRVTQSGGTLFANEAQNGGAVFKDALGEYTMNGGTILNNSAKTYGGGVYASGGNLFTMNDGNISGNAANYGGGVAVSGIAGLNGGTIQNNSAVSGGGVYEVRGRLEMTGGTVRNNRATETGGGIAGFAYLKISGGSIFNNTAKRGGGISFEGESLFYLEGECVVAGNTATDGAGILVSGDCDLDMSEGASVSNNTAENRGGGIFIEQGGLHIEDSSVTDNSAAIGGGVEVAEDCEWLSLRGNAVIENNGEQNLHLCSDMIIVMFPLGEEASIYVSVEGNYAFTSHYTRNNQVDGVTYGKKPSLFFTSDNPEQKIIINDSGELVAVPVLGHPVTWTVTYSDGESQAFTDEYGTTLTYGEHTVTGIWLNGDGENYLDVKEAKNAGEYYSRSSTFASGVSVRFTLAILPCPLDDEKVAVQFAEGEELSRTFTGKEHKPAVELLFNGELMAKDSDYKLDYENNVNAGTAYAVVRGVDGNNFSGELRLAFSIAPSQGIEYGVSWEYRNDNEWAALTEDSLVFNTGDQRGDVRAVLTAFAEDGTQITEYVYAEGFGDDALKNKNLALVFDGETLTDARTYAVQITGTPNGILNDTLKTASLKINRAKVSLSAEDFTFKDENRNRLWVLSGGTQLRDEGTVYFDPEASADKYGNTVTVGALDDAYARFSGEELVLTLNGNYVVNGTPLSALYDFIQIDYAGTNKATGAENAVVPVHTQVQITFGDNYELDAGGNVLTLDKTWYIVVINNRLLREDGGLPAAEIGDVTYGAADLNGFRPEKGNTIIYTIARGAESVFRFAAVFSGSTRYFGVKETDGALQADYENRIYSDTYFNQCMSRLSVGGYTLTAYVPQQEAEGVVYYAFTQVFPFRVVPCSLESDGQFVEGFSYFLLSGEVVYNGKNNNTPRLSVVYGRTTLREGVDYELLSERVNVGSADLSLRGIGNYTGTVLLGSEVYDIVRANNEWVYTPSVAGWKYNGFERTVNRFQAAPALLDEGEQVQFGLFYDERCNTPVSGLMSFTAVNGVVSVSVEERLKALPVGTYYLKTTVRATDNYTGLEPEANALVVERAANDWTTEPELLGWNYLGYDKTVNLILASVMHGSISFRITDAGGKALTQEFTLLQDGYVSDEIAQILLGLPSGNYHLTATVTAGENYAVPSVHTSPFTVGKAVNGWVVTPNINAWVEGGYRAEENGIAAQARFGTVHYRITAADDETLVLFDSAEGIDLLKDAKAGLYVLTAYVSDGDANYTDLSPYMTTFRIFAPAGMPWWGTLLIVVGVLAVAGLILLILHKKGVLQIISGKMVVAIRAKAAADATIAAVRANKKAEEAKVVALAEEQEKQKKDSDGEV